MNPRNTAKISPNKVLFYFVEFIFADLVVNRENKKFHENNSTIISRTFETAKIRIHKKTAKKLLVKNHLY